MSARDKKSPTFFVITLALQFALLQGHEILSFHKTQLSSLPRTVLSSFDLTMFFKCIIEPAIPYFFDLPLHPHPNRSLHFLNLQKSSKLCITLANYSYYLKTSWLKCIDLIKFFKENRLKSVVYDLFYWIRHILTLIIMHCNWLQFTTELFDIHLN